MKKHVKFYIARHGQTEYNIERRAQGWSDSPLTDYGREIARRLGCGLRDIKFDYVYSSSSGRASDTAKIVLESIGVDLPISIDDNLKERGLGKLEGRMLSGGSLGIAREAATTAGYEGKLDLRVLADSYESVMALGEPSLDKPYGTENFDALVIRLKKALDDIYINAKNGESNVLVVSHGFSILAMIYALTGDKYAEGFVDNASITLIENIDGVYYVRKVNDTSYIL